MDLSERSNVNVNVNVNGNGRGQGGAAVARHPWETARQRHFVDVVASTLPQGCGAVLDLGAGDTYIARALLERVKGAQVVACDHAYSDDDLDVLRGHERLEVTRDWPSHDARFDVAMLLDVLEHVADDAALLRRVVRLVKPGGAIVISVPAWPSLVGLHDMQLRHLRRYSPEQARAVVEREGLRVERCGGLFHSLLPVRAVTTRLESRLGLSMTRGVSWSAPSLVTGAVAAVLRADTLVSRALARAHVDAPGLAWWCVARV